MQKSTKETLKRMLLETPMAVAYANTVINAASEASADHCKEMSGMDIPAPERVYFVCEAIITMFKDPDGPVNKDKFLRGLVAFMLAHQRMQAIEKQTGESNKKEETENGLW